ncbi:hypothetical protein CC117_00775 [Parafrankia colletiae]|uniref:Uncharacterized protein n=1 Tax=Parafrankia colletiae TaxID=573497 RepID=A0A1S1RLR8_9ACTN|nr:hypothetical protein [Parafrankia colletiae]MCK9904270.1 hypothetical protein [Frankia sp. Cpl3]OHV46222.1 hypothetical protein CC117_00775 [Parafrankia colletiae]
MEFEPRGLYADDPDDIHPEEAIDRRVLLWRLPQVESEVVNHPKAVPLLDDDWSSSLSSGWFVIDRNSDFRWDCSLSGLSVVEKAIRTHGTLLLFGGPNAGDDIEAAAASQALYGGRLPPAGERDEFL